MKTMIDVKHVGVLRSMRHTPTRGGTNPEGIPHLNLYVLQMNLYKLRKERKVISYRLEEVEKQIAALEEKIISLRPQIESGFPEINAQRPKRKKPNIEEETAGKKVQKMKLSF